MRQYVAFCFYGLLLIFLDFNFIDQVGQIDILSDALGVRSLAYGLHALQDVNSRLHRAYHWSVFYLLAEIIWESWLWSGWLNPYPAVELGLSILGTLLMLVTFSELLIGLSREAARCDLAELADGLQRWQGYMIVIYLASVLTVMSFGLLSFLWAAVWLILFFKLASLLFQCSEKLPAVAIKRPRENSLWVFMPIFALGLALGAAASLVGNLPQTAVIPYTAIADHQTAEVAALRQQLLELGLPQQVVNDFDAEEISRYQGVWKVTDMRIPADSRRIDGQMVRVERYVCYLPEGRARYIGLYRYLNPPEHAYSGIFNLYYADSIQPGRSFLLGGLEDVESLQLFSQRGQTYRLVTLGKDQVRYVANGLQLEFGLPRQGEQIRGYMLVDCQVDWHAPEPTYLALEYWQQTKLRHEPFVFTSSHSKLPIEGYETSAWFAHEEIYYLVHPELL